AAEALCNTARKKLCIERLCSVARRENPGRSTRGRLEITEFLDRPITEWNDMTTPRFAVLIRDGPGAGAKVDVAPAREYELASALPGQQEQRQNVREMFKARSGNRVIEEELQRIVREEAVARLFLA